jgi:hypothetical protein
MLEVQQYDDRVYTTREVCDILGRGVNPETLAVWPFVTLPEYVIAVARAEASTYPDVLDEAQRLRRGLRTEWGMLVVDLRWMPDDPSGWTLDVQVFLAEDPCLELTHLRRGPGETVGIFLSDLAKSVIEYGPAASAMERLRGTPFKVTKIRAPSVFSNRNRSQWRGSGRSGGTLSRTQPDQRDGAPGVATRP